MFEKDTLVLQRRARIEDIGSFIRHLRISIRLKSLQPLLAVIKSCPFIQNLYLLLYPHHSHQALDPLSLLKTLPIRCLILYSFTYKLHLSAIDTQAPLSVNLTHLLLHLESIEDFDMANCKTSALAPNLTHLLLWTTFNLKETIIRRLLDHCPRLFVFIFRAYLMKEEYLPLMDDPQKRLLLMEGISGSHIELWRTVEIGSYNLWDLVDELQAIRKSGYLYCYH